MKILKLIIGLSILTSFNLSAFEVPTALADEPAISPGSIIQQQGDDSPEATEADRNGFLNDTTIEVLEQFQQESGFKTFTDTKFENTVRAPGLDGLTGIIYTAIGILKYAIGSVAALVIIISIITMITAGDDGSEEAYGKVKTNITYAIVSVVMMISIEFFFTQVFVVAGGSFLDSQAAARRFALIGAGEIQGIYNFIQATLATIAIFMIIYAAFRMVTNAGDEELTEKMKNQVIYAVFGLFLVSLSEFVIKDIIFVDGGATFNRDSAMRLIVDLTNYFAGFITFAAFLGFLYGGYLYIVSGVTEDNTEKVKKIFLGGIIAILIAAAGFAVVNTVIQLDSDTSPQILQNQLDNISR